MTESYVSNSDFIKILREAYCFHKGCEFSGIESGSTEACLDRKNAACLVHNFLLEECKEADEPDILPAKQLKDLYDCHVCVNHVAQVYVKGIMEAKQSVFGMKEYLTKEEAEQIVSRIFDRKKRVPPSMPSEQKRGYRLTYRQAVKRSANDVGVILIDVRTAREYEENHIDGAKNIPLNEILKNPYIVGGDRFHPFLFYCEIGYQSEIAAACILEAGYAEAGYFALQ